MIQAMLGQIASCSIGTRWILASFLVLSLSQTALAATPADSVDYVLTSSVNPAQVGQALTLELKVTGLETNVSFFDGAAPLCTNVGFYSSGGVQRADCVATFSTTGIHNITATFELGGGVTEGTALAQKVVDVVPFDGDQFALTGAWSDPALVGEGMMFEVFADQAADGVGGAFGSWFFLDVNGQPQWVSMQGTLAAAHGAAYSLDIYESENGKFNAGPPIGATPVGMATLTFTDCTHATFTYAYQDSRSGTLPLVRLSDPSYCTTVWPANSPVPRPAPPPNYNDALHSGAWYNQATAGQGLLIDIVPEQATFFAGWFTYAPASSDASGVESQRWFSLQMNDYTPGNLKFTGVPIYSSRNAPPLLTVTTTQVGTADVTFNSCTQMTITYTFTQGEFSGMSGTIDEQTAPTTNGCDNFQFF